jgi:hypothetical protein
MDIEVGDVVIYKGRRATVLEVDANMLLVAFSDKLKVWVQRSGVVRVHRIDADIKLDLEEG